VEMDPTTCGNSGETWGCIIKTDENTRKKMQERTNLRDSTTIKGKVMNDNKVKLRKTVYHCQDKKKKGSLCLGAVRNGGDKILRGKNKTLYGEQGMGSETLKGGMESSSNLSQTEGI